MHIIADFSVNVLKPNYLKTSKNLLKVLWHANFLKNAKMAYFYGKIINTDERHKLENRKGI